MGGVLLVVGGSILLGASVHLSLQAARGLPFDRARLAGVLAFLAAVAVTVLLLVTGVVPGG